MTGTGEYGPLRMRSLSVPSDDLHGDDGVSSLKRLRLRGSPFSSDFQVI